MALLALEHRQMFEDRVVSLMLRMVPLIIHYLQKLLFDFWSKKLTSLS